MQFSPNNAIMYVSMVDAGTVEFLRSLGKGIVSSADLVSQFEAVLTDEQMLLAPARIGPSTISSPRVLEIRRRLRLSRRSPAYTEYDHVQLAQRGHAARQAWPGRSAPRERQPNSSDSHYEPTADHSRHCGKAIFCSSTSGAFQPPTRRLLRHHLDGRDRP